MTASTAHVSLTLSERLTNQFYRWERRGRGWQLWDTPLDLEPPFAPFWGHWNDDLLPDDGRQQTFLSSIVGSLKSFVTRSTPPAQSVADEEDPMPKEASEGHGRSELQITLPADFDPSCRSFEAFLLSTSRCRHPVSLEFLGDSESVRILISADNSDIIQVESQLEGHFPDAVVNRAEQILQDAWDRGQGSAFAVDFGLSRECMLPLKTHTDLRVDPLIALTAALSRLRDGEVAIFQILFQPVRNPWSESILRAIMWPDGTSFFDNGADFTVAAKEKVRRPLFAAAVRIAVIGEDEERMWDIGRELTSVLAAYKNPVRNELIPLSNDEYDHDQHIEDVLQRRSRRSGMLLNSEELVSLAHLPAKEVRSQKLDRVVHKSKAAPATATGHSLVLGANAHNGRSIEVSLGPDQRVRHMHVIGASGTGKSTFFLNCIVQDIEQGNGIGVLDPHGDLIDQIIARIPEERHEDVVLLDLADEEFPIGFNILSAHSDLEKTLLASDLVGIFRRFSTSWGDQMGSVLGNAVLAFLESSRGGTLADLRRFLIEPSYRNELLTTVQDPHVAYYWKKEFPLLSGRPQAPILTRLDAFLRPKPIRYMVAQKDNRLDFSHIMDTKKIFLAKLAQGAVGEENAYLLGALLLAKFHQLTLGRQSIAEHARQYFWLYCDEFGGYVTPSMARLLSGARKYRLGLVLAHQELRQLHDEEVKSALLANAGTRICFRVGDEDAKALKSSFASFDAEDLGNLSTGEAICRVGRAGDDFNLTTNLLDDVPADIATSRRKAILEHTRRIYATTRTEVEELLTKAVESGGDESAASEKAGKKAKKDLSQEKDTPKEQFAAPEAPPLPSPGPIAEPEPVVPTLKKPKPMPSVPKQRGKGGQKHRYFQELLAQWGQGMGYKATIEMPTADGGSVDVVLEKDGRRIACEISVTSTVEQELGNLRKCLAGGFGEILMILVEPKTLNELKKSAQKELGEGVVEKVRFVSPEEVLSTPELLYDGLPREQMVRGYKVKVVRKVLESAEIIARKGRVTKILSNATKIVS